MSTRDCPHCQRESGFHTPDCPSRSFSDSALSRIRAQVAQVYADILVYAADSANLWRGQLVEKAGALVGTIRWIEADIACRARDEEEKRRNG